MVYNLKRPVRAHDALPVDFYSECDSTSTIEAIAEALRRGGHAVHLVEADANLPAWLAAHPVNVVFNIAEGAAGPHRESQVPAILESLGIPFTGSDSVTLALALDKARTKQVLAYEGIATPAWQLFEHVEAALNPKLAFPLIVKPNHEGSAKGIWRDSVVRDEIELRRQIRRILEQYRQPALVEEFIDGIELTVGVLGNAPSMALPVLEIDFASCATSGEFFYSWPMKEYQGDIARGLAPTFHCPARLEVSSTRKIQALAIRAHQALGCREFSRTDIRLRADGVPFVLEINPLPGLDPSESNFPIMTTAAGLSYPTVINRLVEMAVVRSRGSARLQEPPSHIVGASISTCATGPLMASPATP